MNDRQKKFDRSTLRFAESVQNHFSFLESSGFRRAQSEAMVVQYKSEKINVRIYLDPRGHEIDLDVELSPSAETYHLSEILFLADPKRAQQYKCWAADSPEGINEGVRQLAKHFKYCLASATLNDPSIFSRLEQQRKIRIRDYAQDIRLKQAMRESATAWKNKNFKQVIKILSPLQEFLDSTSLKKLEYSKKQLNKAS